MPAFEYKALNSQGKKVSGVIQADTLPQARQQVRDKSLLLVEIHTGSKSSDSQFRLGRARLSHLELCEFTRQFAVLLGAGIAIDEALLSLSSQSANKETKKCALSLRSLLMEGYSLSDAMAGQPQVFSRLYRTMVTAGEESGALAVVLEKLADYLDKTRAVKTSIRMAMTYPIILTLVATGVIFILMSYVVPKIVDQFNHAGQSLPLLTELLIQISQFLNQNWLYILLGVFLVSLLGRYFFALKAVSNKVDTTLLKIPLIKHYVLLIAYARLSRTLSILLASGLNLIDALKVSAQVVNNSQLRGQVRTIHEQVEQGASLSKAFKLIATPPMFDCLVENGEQSGELSQSFERAANLLESSLEERLKVALTLFEPLLILVMGGCVLGIVLAILLPILELNNMTLM